MKSAKICHLIGGHFRFDLYEWYLVYQQTDSDNGHA